MGSQRVRERSMVTEKPSLQYNNPPIPWSELERTLSDRSRPDGHGGRPVEADMLTGLTIGWVRVGRVGGLCAR